MEMLQILAQLLVAKFPVLASIGANALALAMAMNLVTEVLELAVSLTASVSDDAAVAKVKAIRDKVMPVLELIPHTNIPLAASVVKITGIIAKAASILKAALSAAKE